MLSNKPFALIAAALAIAAVPASAKNPMVGGAAMYPTKNIVQNALNSRDHTTLVAAVKAAGLVETLSGKGPFTVFAPTNRAFAKLPAGTVETLVKPENKGTLTSILTYHVLPGRITAGQITAAAARHKGVATFITDLSPCRAFRDTSSGALPGKSSSGDRPSPSPPVSRRAAAAACHPETPGSSRPPC